MRIKFGLLMVVFLLAMALAGCIPANASGANEPLPTAADQPEKDIKTQPTHEIGIPEQPLPNLPSKGDGFKGPIKVPETPNVTTALVMEAKRDLASRLSVSQDAIDLVSVEPHTWPDSSLGVYDKGRMYTQVLTPGYLIRLTNQGIEYDYHTDSARVVYAGKK